MAHLADEEEYAELTSRERPESAFDVPDIATDRRALRAIPWHGDGPDPLGEDVA